MPHLFIFGLGYSAGWIRAAALARGWQVSATGSAGDLPFDDEQAVRERLARATHVLSSIPPAREGDPVLARYGDALPHDWLGYLSSTGVYGDTGGAWVDESAPTLLPRGAAQADRLHGPPPIEGASHPGDPRPPPPQQGAAQHDTPAAAPPPAPTGRRTARAEADAAWLHRGARVFRLPGIYGPGRSALDRVREGRAHRIDLPEQVFSRVHVEDIASGVLAALAAPPGAYNLADDLPASQNAVIEEACRLLGREPPPLLPLDEAGLSPMARGFYAENRRVANSKARRVLGWRPRYPDFRSGLTACL